jgi:predicted dehydrogenase
MAHRIGIIGLGVMGERMVRQMNSHRSFVVAAAWDPAEGAAEKLARLSPAARFAESAQALVADPAIDGVYIASPPASHLAHVQRAFDRGKPVLCEKPLATDVNEARAAVARVEREARAAAINFPFASAPAMRAIASGLRSGELGAIRGIDIILRFAHWPRAWQESATWLARRAEGGFVREVLSHFLFLTQRLIGPLRIGKTRVDYPATGDGAESGITAELDAGSVPVRIDGRVGGAEADLNRWILSAERGAFELHDWYSLKRRINGGWLDVDFGEGASRELAARAQLEAFSAMLQGKAHGLASFREGLAVLESVETMLRGGG